MSEDFIDSRATQIALGLCDSDGRALRHYKIAVAKVKIAVAKVVGQLVLDDRGARVGERGAVGNRTALLLENGHVGWPGSRLLSARAENEVDQPANYNGRHRVVEERQVGEPAAAIVVRAHEAEE